jgi:hypothetical protein
LAFLIFLLNLLLSLKATGAIGGVKTLPSIGLGVSVPAATGAFA